MTIETSTSTQNETLRNFLQQELDETGGMLDSLRKKLDQQNARGIKAWFGRIRGRIDQEDFRSLEEDYKDKSRRLKELSDDDVRLFLLRREIGTLKEDVSALGSKRNWRIPPRAWLLIIVVPFIIYFATLAILQGQNQEGISASATATAAARPTMVASPTVISTPLPTTIQ